MIQTKPAPYWYPQHMKKCVPLSPLTSSLGSKLYLKHGFIDPKFIPSHPTHAKSLAKKSPQKIDQYLH